MFCENVVVPVTERVTTIATWQVDYLYRSRRAKSSDEDEESEEDEDASEDGEEYD